MSTAVQPESVNYRAAKAVALHVRDTAEARLFLDMLGLVSGPQGHGILPDDSRQYDVPALGAVPAADRDGSPIVLSVAAERGDRMTTPAGLRQLPDAPPIPPAAALPQPTSEAPMPEPAPTLPTRSYTHGTRGGYQGHRRRGEDACEACKAANRDDQRARAKAKASGALSPEERAEAVVTRIEKAAADYALAAHPLIEMPGGDLLADWELELLKANGGRAREIAAAYGAEPSAVSAVELDVWLAAAALSSSKPVQRSARAASSALLQLHAALDELARAERAAASRSAEVR